MTLLTQRNLEYLLGPLDETTVLALQATGASLKDIEEAQALADGASDIVGQGEQDLPQPVAQALTILLGART